MAHICRLFIILSLLRFACGSCAAAALEGKGAGYRAHPLTVPTKGKTGFSLLSSATTGLQFTNQLSQERSLTNQIYLNGSGVALGDVDGDGRCDVYLCGLDNPNALYKNLGDFKFEQITANAGVACADQASTGAAFADVDGDGDLDLLVTGVRRGVRLFLNDGRGRFREATEAAGLGGSTGSTSLALADVDGNGWLDLYVVNYRSRTLRDEPDTRFKVSTLKGEFRLLSVDNQPATNAELQGRFSVDPVTGILENGEPDVLYLNQGGGKFVAASWTQGRFLDAKGKAIAVPYDWGLSAMFHDLNEDGAPDLYVCNDFQSEDRVWINDGRGNFRELAPRALRHTGLFSMGVDFADLDGDGHDEICVADMLSRSHARRQVQISDRKMMPAGVGAIDDRPQYSRNMLYWNRGDGTYAEIAQFSGVEAADWCWCPVFLDVDLDGYPDLLMVTGHERDAQNIDLSRRIEAAIRQRPMSRVAQMQLRKLFPVYATPNFAFRNRQDLTFEETGTAWGFDSTQVSQGIALADLDGDGDLDVVISCLNGPVLVYRNDSTAPRLAVHLRGTAPNLEAIGARIRVSAPGFPVQSREVTSGGRYLSSDDRLATFAMGSASHRARVEVVWRDGRRSTIRDLPANHSVEIDATDAEPAPPQPVTPTVTWFENASAIMRHTHQEVAWDDFARQPMLPRRFSQGGPGVTWFDLDRDGWEDLVIGAAKGGKMAGFKNDGHGGFAPMTDPAFAGTITRDQTAIIAQRRSDGGVELLAGSANYEDGLTNGGVARVFQLGGSSAGKPWPGQRASTGPLTLGPGGPDGQLLLWVGGQVIPGRYPEPASGMMFQPQGKDWGLDEVATRTFEKVGLVNSAVWSDLNNDGVPELILACEWGPLRIYQRKGTVWQEVTEAWGLTPYSGWWQSVTAGDFDGDGTLDLAAGNWGRNSKYQAYLAQPLRLYSSDLNGDGTSELIEAQFDPDLKKFVPSKDWESLARILPFIRERYHSFTEFSLAGVEEILGARLKEFQVSSVTTLDSMVFLNRHGQFEARPLPKEAQWALGFGLAVADFDGDGKEDLFLNQNFFAVPPETSRYDAGSGLILRGRGDGTFHPILGAESGIRVDGEGRGAAVCDYDHDGRPDLAIGQNANPTLLYHNRTGKPGLRVELQGPVGNPSGIGVTLQIEDAEGGRGPIREVHAGSGYWSQDAVTQILSTPRAAVAVLVRWPGGKTQRVPVPAGASQVQAIANEALVR